MREVEFLPAWYPQARRRRRLLVLQAWLTLVMVAGMGAWVVMKDRNVATDELTLSSLTAQLAQTDAQLAEIDKLNTMRRQLGQQDRIMQRLGLYVDACGMMHALDSLMPRQMSLVGVQLENEERVETSAVLAAKGEQPVDRRLKVKVQGVCPTDVDLANFMTQLTTVPFFDQVSITYAREKAENNHVMREFEISFSLNLNATGS